MLESQNQLFMATRINLGQAPTIDECLTYSQVMEKMGGPRPSSWA